MLLHNKIRDVAIGESDPLKPCGNYVAIEGAPGENVYICHLRKGSVTVAVGDVVAPGDPIGQVGNSGNTSEPHIHMHVQDGTSVFAGSVPLVFGSIAIDGAQTTDASLVRGQTVSHAASPAP